jgi:hypothetical protein
MEEKREEKKRREQNGRDDRPVEQVRLSHRSCSRHMSKFTACTCPCM